MLKEPLNDHPTEVDDDFYSEKCPNISASFSKKISKACSVEGWKQKFPITQWLPNYQKSYFLQDVVAGISVGLTAIPQGIAYGVVAGLPPQYGLYSSFMSCFVYLVFGTCKDITIGPTALTALMIQRVVVKYNADFAVLGTFLCGCVIFLLGIFNLGFLVQFISTPTISGFISSAMFIIGSGQVKSLLGIKSGDSGDFVSAWINVFKNIKEVKLSDTLLGVSSLAFLLAMKHINKIKKWKTFFKWFGISKNAIIVICGIVIAYVFHINGKEPFRLTGPIKEGLPDFRFPPTSSVSGDTVYDFWDMFDALGLLLVTIPLVSILEMMAIAKAFSKGKVVDATQELIALGLSNMAGGFVSSIPITGSLTRTAINHNSGVKTQLGGIFDAVLVLLALGLLTNTFYFIPKATLAAVIINSMFTLIDIKEIKEIYRSKRIDFIPFLGTFLFSLWLGLEYGILIGVAISIVFTLYKTSRPDISFHIEEVKGMKTLVVAPSQSLMYSSAEYFKTSLLKKTTDASIGDADVIVINGESVDFIDSTTAKILSSIITDMEGSGKAVIFWNWKPEASHVLIRLNRDHIGLFKSSEFLLDVFENENANLLGVKSENE